jgi:hypothetical protein
VERVGKKREWRVRKVERGEVRVWVRRKEVRVSVRE